MLIMFSYTGEWQRDDDNDVYDNDDYDNDAYDNDAYDNVYNAIC